MMASFYATGYSLSIMLWLTVATVILKNYGMIASTVLIITLIMISGVGTYYYYINDYEELLLRKQQHHKTVD